MKIHRFKDPPVHGKNPAKSPPKVGYLTCRCISEKVVKFSRTTWTESASQCLKDQSAYAEFYKKELEVSRPKNGFVRKQKKMDRKVRNSVNFLI